MNRALPGHSSMPIEAIQLPGDRLTLIGTAADLHQQLEARRLAGVLRSATDPVPTHDGRFLTTVTVLRHRQLAPVTNEPDHRRRVVGLVAVASVLAVAVVVAGLILWQLRTYILGGFVVGVGAWVLLGRVGLCPGIHCPGCKHK